MTIRLVVGLWRGRGEGCRPPLVHELHRDIRGLQGSEVLALIGALYSWCYGSTREPLPRVGERWRLLGCARTRLRTRGPSWYDAYALVLAQRIVKGDKRGDRMAELTESRPRPQSGWRRTGG